MSEHGLETYLDEQERAALPPLHRHLPNLAEATLPEDYRPGDGQAENHLAMQTTCVAPGCTADISLLVWVVEDGNSEGKFLTGGWNVDYDPYAEEEPDEYDGEGGPTQEDVDEELARMEALRAADPETKAFDEGVRFAQQQIERDRARGL